MKPKAFRRKLQIPDEQALQKYLKLIETEYRKARATYPPMISFNEGKSLIEDAVLKLKLELLTSAAQITKAEQHAIEISAMALSLLVDLVDPFLKEDQH
jgi:hypothetical protein